MKLWMGETTIEFKKNLVNILGYEEDNHIKPDYTNLLDYWQIACQTLEAFRSRKRIEQVHSKVLAIHRNKILNSRNRENIDHPTSTLDQVIRLEMMGNHDMSEKDYTSLFFTHLTMLKVIRTTLFWVIKCLADNTTWQDRIRNEIIQMKHNGMYSVENLQFESIRDLKMFVNVCVCTHQNC
jgi:hypothetical protein